MQGQMVFSRIKMASSSPYSRVLKDHNRLRDGETNSQFQVAFQKNCKELVRDHPHTHIDENSQYRLDNKEKTYHNFCSMSSTKEAHRVESSTIRRRQSRVLDQWAARQAHEAELLALSNSQTVSTSASTFLTENSPTQSESSVDLPNLRASSLVHKWKEFEVNSNSSSLCSSCRMNSIINNIENSSVCDSTDERYENSFTDSESDQITPSESPSSSQGQVSDIGESERVRVADIIRRLTSFNRIQSSLTSSHEIDRNVFPFIGNRPRIRGRQAIMDLFLRMKQERESELSRLEERRVVSRFPQWRRIQSLLRLRLLQNKVDVQDQCRPASTSELDQLRQRSTILHLRQRFNPKVKRDDGGAILSQGDNMKSHTELQNSTLDSQHSVMSDELTIQDIHQQVVTTFEHNHSMPPIGEHLQEEANVSWQGSSLNVSNINIDLQGPLYTTPHGWDGEASTEEIDLDMRQHEGSIDDWERVTVTEELDLNTHIVKPIDETCLSDVYPPHRDGKDRCHDMLENYSDNEEICELLERRNVSNLLSSGFRERMERLVLSYLQRQRHWARIQNVKEEEENKPSEFHYHEVSDDYDRIAPTSLQLPQPCHSYFQDTQQCSPFINRPSFEMELIYELRGNMARLHHEMSELRKSVESCVGMQVKLQKSIKQEISTAVSHSIRGVEEMEVFNRVPMRKGNCCICYEMQVDSLLYRCGHMCTCFKCAHELQWSSGRCPICQDTIVDVVRAYSDS